MSSSNEMLFSCTKFQITSSYRLTHLYFLPCLLIKYTSILQSSIIFRVEMASKKLTKPNTTTSSIPSSNSSSTWPGSGMSRTLANALIPNRNSNDRRVERPGPIPYVHTPAYSSALQNSGGAVLRVGDGSQLAQGIARSRSEDEYYNERYYQAQIAHLQTALVREHGLFVRVTIGFSILVSVMLVFILFLLQRPANCDATGKPEAKWNVNIPILSPWTSTHEKEQHTTTTTAAGWSLTTVLLLTSLCLLAWQNRNTMLKPMFEFVTSHIGEIRHLLLR